MLFNFRFVITRLRISTYSLRIQTGRYLRQRLPRNDIICSCCILGDIECEYRFILLCSSYQTLRRICINPTITVLYNSNGYMYGCCLTVLLLYVYCVFTVWLLYVYCMVTVWLLYVYCMFIVW